ncbi:MAG: metallophosphoesterase [Thermoplasmata archaeon]
MRILQMSDLHGSDTALEQSRWALREFGPDLFLVTGDITNFGPLDYVHRLFSDIAVPSYALPGNCDPREIVPLLEELGVNLHGKRTEFRGHPLIGLGGSSPTPFHTLFELSEEEIRATLEPLMVEGSILATHAPPYGHVDDSAGRHLGSRSIRTLVDRYPPRVVLCGHIHEARGVETGPTTYVNPGPARSGHAALVDLEEEVRVRLLP